MTMEPMRQHYMLATGKGVQPAPDPNPKPDFIKPGKDWGTASDPFPNPMTTRPKGK
jgi:hypothetical protein